MKLSNDLPKTLSVAVDNSKSYEIDYDKIFDEPCFIERLRLEKQRAQRSGSALSILMLTQINTKDEDSLSIREILKTVQTNTRETDIVGYIDKHTLGVLLPYTDEKGAKINAEKITRSHQNKQFVITTATYPDHIFESLAKNGSVSPDVFKLMLEDSSNNSRISLLIKRVIDIIGSIVALLVLSPVMALIAILIKFDSPGPVIFKQIRLGKKGAPFTFYKFRSMYIDTNDQIHRDYITKFIDGNHSAINNGNKDAPMYKIKFDPRVTTIGRFIRKTSIDELPQFYNVIRGEMSLVGPRPPLAYEAEKYQSWHLRRVLEMKPGITGLWQIEGRGRAEFNESTRLDIRYIRKWSLWLDIKILFKTVKVVLQGRGAV